MAGGGKMIKPHLRAITSFSNIQKSLKMFLGFYFTTKIMLTCRKRIESFAA